MRLGGWDDPPPLPPHRRRNVVSTIAVTVIGTNLVMDYGTHEAAVAAMGALLAPSEIERLQYIEQLAVTVVAATQPGDLDDAISALNDALGGLDG